MQSIRNRRQILLGGGALLASTTLPAQPISSESKATGGVLRMTRGGTPQFKALLARHYPALTADPNFAAVAPLCYLLQNRSSLGVRALAMQWSVATGKSVFSHPMLLELPARRNSIRTGQRTLMGSRGFLLVSPFFAWHPGAVPTGPINWIATLAGSGTRRFLASELLASKAIGLQYHGIIYVDGTTVGPATRHLAKRTLLTQAGERDTAHSIAKHLRRGATPAELEAILTAYVNWRPANFPSNNLRIYQDSRRDQAYVLLRALKKSPGSFQSIVEENASQLRFRLI